MACIPLPGVKCVEGERVVCPKCVAAWLTIISALVVLFLVARNRDKIHGSDD
jgi:uncharacterized membrane protein